MKIRKAKSGDLQSVILLLQDDDLGKTREEIDTDAYTKPMDEILNSECFDLFVMELGGDVIGCYQMFYLPHLSFQGTKRAQIESVRVRSGLRGNGYGRKLMEHAITIAKENHCGILQLTSNKARKDASRFYRDFGFRDSHEGYKLFFS